MATSGSKSVAVTSYNTLKFNWAQYGQSTANNYTQINWSLQLVSGSAGQIISSASKKWSVTVNGTTYTGTNSVAVSNNSTITLASGQTTIYHNADGTKTFNYSFSQEFGITFAGSQIGTVNGNGTGELNTIPRATTPVPHATSADMGTTLTIYTYRASTEFTHDLEYSFAGGTYKVLQSNVDTVVYWEIPLDLAKSIPNTTSGTLTIRCTTKKGDTVIGTKTALVTAKVPTTLTPTITSVTHAEAAVGLPTDIGAYVQNKSKVEVNIEAVGIYGSTIKSYSSTLLGKTYTGASFTSDTVTMGGSLSIVTTVTDSRGRTESKTTNLTALTYTPPQITTFHVARYNASGNADPDGAYAQIQLAYSVTPLNDKNTASAKVQYKKSTDSNWISLYNRTDLTMASTLKPAGALFSTDYQWDFKVELTDAFTSASPTIYTAVLPSGAVILDIKADGKGIAFFKTSTKAGVEIAGELPGSAINLTTNANLDNLTTPGFYVIPTTTISGTITNKPYSDTATASIRVEQTGTGMVKQILQKSTKTDGVIYERGYDSSGWGAWNIVYSGTGKILWTGNYVMNASQSLTFSENLSQQQHGVVLVFSRYATSGEQNYAFSCHFISKLFVSTAGGTTGVNMNIIMATTKFDYVAGKTLTITNTGISGHADNTATGKNETSGIYYYNDKFALRYVIGV